MIVKFKLNKNEGSKVNMLKTWTAALIPAPVSPPTGYGPNSVTSMTGLPIGLTVKQGVCTALSDNQPWLK